MQLRQFVDVPTAQPATDPGDARSSRRAWTTVAVVERRHGAELDDAERLLIEAIAPLQEEQRTPALEADEQGDPDEQRREQHQPPAATITSNMRFCIRSNRLSGARVSCRLAIRAVLGDAHIVEAIEDALGAEMDLDRDVEEFLDAAGRSCRSPTRAPRCRPHPAAACARCRSPGADRRRAPARRASRRGGRIGRVNGAAPTVCSPKFHG